MNLVLIMQFYTPKNNGIYVPYRLCKLKTNLVHVNHSVTNEVTQIIIESYIALFCAWLKYIGCIRTANLVHCIINVKLFFNVVSNIVDNLLPTLNTHMYPRLVQNTLSPLGKVPVTFHCNIVEGIIIFQYSP